MAHDRIEINPEIMGGKPVIRGTRIPVETVLRKLGAGMTVDAILADVKAKYNVDPKRVFVIGHSNGGFMSHRLACDRASDVAAIVSLAGATWLEWDRLRPACRLGGTRTCQWQARTTPRGPRTR